MESMSEYMKEREERNTYAPGSRASYSLTIVRESTLLGGNGSCGSKRQDELEDGFRIYCLELIVWTPCCTNYEPVLRGDEKRDS